MVIYIKALNFRQVADVEPVVAKLIVLKTLVEVKFINIRVSINTPVAKKGPYPAHCL